MDPSDPVGIWIDWEHEKVPGNLFQVEEWRGEMELTGYRFDFFRSKSELERVKREMAEKLVRDNPPLWNRVYGVPGAYRLVVSSFKFVVEKEWERGGFLVDQRDLRRPPHLRRRRRKSFMRQRLVKISLPRAHQLQVNPELFLFEPFPSIPYLMVQVSWSLRMEPVQCRRPVFYDFFDALLYRRNPPPRSRKHQKRLAKRRWRWQQQQQQQQQPLPDPVLIKALQATRLDSPYPDQQE
jgi:hypothetical protein